MAKRTIKNCSLVKRMVRLGLGEPEKQADGKCLGYAGGSEDDEPCEICKVCKLNTAYKCEA